MVFFSWNLLFGAFYLTSRACSDYFSAEDIYKIACKFAGKMSFRQQRVVLQTVSSQTPLVSSQTVNGNL